MKKNQKTKLNKNNKLEEKENNLTNKEKHFVIFYFSALKNKI